jgi:hypothetical protein
MKPSKRQIVVLSSVLVTFFAFTRTTPAQNFDSASSAAVIVGRAAAAHGGRWASGQIADSISQGTLTFLTSDGPKVTFDVSVFRKYPAQVQRIIKESAGDLKQGTDGSKSWESVIGFSTPEAHGRSLAFLESHSTRSVERLLNFQKEALTLRDLGANDKSHLIEAEDQRGKKSTYFIDNDTNVITQLEFVVGQLKDPFSGATVDDIDRYVFSDYRMVQGVLTPFKVERFNGGDKTEEMQFSSISYNAGLKDQDFQR